MFEITNMSINFNIQILTVMKRTFISSLVESNKKSNKNSKYDKNMKPSTKFIFQQHKENIHPNLTYQNSTKKYQKLKSQSKFKSSRKGRSSSKKVQTYQPQEQSFLSPFKRDAQKEEHIELIKTLKGKCTKLKLLLVQKHQKQIKKCREYYDFIRQQLFAQQMTALSQINNCFQQAHQQIDQYRAKIDKSPSLRTYTLDFIIEIPLMTVSITQEMKQSVKLQLTKLSLLNQASEVESNKIQNNFQAIKFQYNNTSKIFQTPIHSQDYCNQRKTHQNQSNSYFGIASVKQDEMSPSFRHF